MEQIRTGAIAADVMLSVVIYVLRVSISLFWGYPKSMVSAPCRQGERNELRGNRRTINKFIYQHKIVLY